MDRYQVKLGKSFDLSDLDPKDHKAFPEDKEEGRSRLAELREELGGLQELLYAVHEHAVLIVLQGMDTSGKDGAIRNIFNGVSPQGIRIASFKVPSSEERAHDYLWRAYKQLPAKGEIVIFNRSHYEAVLAERVLKLVPKAVWKRRYDQINDFERLQTEEGTLVLKFYLHISKGEQKERLLERLNDPAKNWKLTSSDLESRKQWPDYAKAYEDLLSRTSTKRAPWVVVPAERKWYRDLVIGTTLVERLKGLKMKVPETTLDLSQFRAALETDEAIDD